MRRSIFLASFFAFALAAQTDRYFTIGTAQLQIGQEQGAVLTYLRQLYDVHNAGGETWLVADKKAAGLKKLGTVTFEEGRLADIGSTWAEASDPGAIEFANRLVAAVHNQQLNGPTTVILRPMQTNNGTAQTEGFEILIGNRTVQVITSSTVQNGRTTAQYATVMENLHDPRFASSLKRSASK